MNVDAEKADLKKKKIKSCFHCTAWPVLAFLFYCCSYISSRFQKTKKKVKSYFFFPFKDLVMNFTRGWKVSRKRGK